MGKKLIIVESPAKARTIGNILDKNYIVESSVGHIRDLPRSRFGVDVNNHFVPEYVTISGKQKVIAKIQKASKQVDEIYLAADPDREGEAICWHLMHYLEHAKIPIYRILYFEITRQAILRSLDSPLSINVDKVNAQQARRILDRIVGYRLSPLLWKKVRRGLSAGRVQSVALKIICDREKEIQAFVPQEYWVLSANLLGQNPPPFKAVYHGTTGKKQKLPDEKSCSDVYSDVEKHMFIVADITRKKVMRYPPAPFITSTLQQEASRRYRFPAQKTMRLAQVLYEGKDIDQKDIHGLITYMRTDSPRISSEAQTAAREFLTEKYGMDYIPEKPPQYKARKGAQEAHEAIRPTSISLTPQIASRYLTPDELKLYRLIWERFMASQMAPAIQSVTTIKINAGDMGRHEFRAMGTELLFKGYLELAGIEEPNKKKTGEDENDSDEEKSESFTNQVLPSLEKGETLKCLKLESKQNYTKPPPRFTEATLVRELEANGIGRPSTYAAIMATLRNHDYAIIEGRRFHPTELGFAVTDLLSDHFPEIMSIKFTAEMETQLDDVESGKAEWQHTIQSFYLPFESQLAQASQHIESITKSVEIVPDRQCPQCGSSMVVRWGKRGRFLSCDKFPNCKGLLPYSDQASQQEKPKSKSTRTLATCNECGALLVLKKGKFGLFLTCSRFPACKGKGPKPEGLPCAKENCDGKLIQRRRKGRKSFFGCSNYPNCDYIFAAIPVPMPCDACGHSYVGAIEKSGEIMLICPRCNHHLKNIEEEVDTDHGSGNPTVSDISGS